MADQNQLAELEAERDRLLSMIAYHNRPIQTPAWFPVIMIAGFCCLGVTILAGIFAGQISASAILFLVVALPLLAYIFSRKITALGNTVLVGEIFALFAGVITPVGQPAGEPQVRQRLADCEARIMKLKEDRS